MSEQELSGNQVAHLGMIQGVITRMASNSFYLKSLAVTIAAAVAAIGASRENPNIYLFLVAVVPMLLFAWLDAQYLQLERQFRRLYDHVRSNDSEAKPFAMNPAPYKSKVDNIWKTVWSWSVWPLYAVIIAVLVAITIVVAVDKPLAMQVESATVMAQPAKLADYTT